VITTTSVINNVEYSIYYKYKYIFNGHMCDLHI